MADFFKETEEVDESEEDIVTLFNENTQEEEDFYHLATLDYKEKWYVVLKPVNPAEDIGEDEVLIYEIREDENQNTDFQPVEDAKILDAVFAEFMKMVDEEE